MRKILITGLFTYPFGGPGANYMRLLARGMLEAGTNVHVLALDPVEASDVRDEHTQAFVHDKVLYESSARFAFGSVESGFQRLLRTPGIVARSVRRLDLLLRGGDVDAVLLYVRSYTKARPLVSVARRHKVPVFMHLVEWPTSEVYKLGRMNPLYWDHRTATLSLVRKCTGAVVITSFLEQRLQGHGRPVLRVPSVAAFSTGDEAAPQYKPSEPPAPFVLLFSGAMKGTDDVLTMLEAFQIAVRRGSNVVLKIVGTDCARGKARAFRRRVEADDAIAQRVEFLGRVSDQGYLKALHTADAMLFPRSLEPRALGAFPMRIPEYLALGKPLITTAVPDVPDYLIDRKHACVAKPGDAIDLADRICWIAGNRGEAKTMAHNGFDQGRQCFDYRKQSQRILDFFRQTIAGQRQE